MEGVQLVVPATLSPLLVTRIVALARRRQVACEVVEHVEHALSPAACVTDTRIIFVCHPFDSDTFRTLSRNNCRVVGVSMAVQMLEGVEMPVQRVQHSSVLAHIRLLPAMQGPMKEQVEQVARWMGAVLAPIESCNLVLAASVTADVKTAQRRRVPVVSVDWIEHCWEHCEKNPLAHFDLEIKQFRLAPLTGSTVVFGEEYAERGTLERLAATAADLGAVVQASLSPSVTHFIGRLTTAALARYIQISGAVAVSHTWLVESQISECWSDEDRYYSEPPLPVEGQATPTEHSPQLSHEEYTQKSAQGVDLRRSHSDGPSRGYLSRSTVLEARARARASVSDSIERLEATEAGPLDQRSVATKAGVPVRSASIASGAASPTRSTSLSSSPASSLFSSSALAAMLHLGSSPASSPSQSSPLSTPAGVRARQFSSTISSLSVPRTASPNRALADSPTDPSNQLWYQTFLTPASSTSSSRTSLASVNSTSASPVLSSLAHSPFSRRRKIDRTSPLVPSLSREGLDEAQSADVSIAQFSDEPYTPHKSEALDFKRKHIIDELLDKEEKFAANLTTIIEVFKNPIAESDILKPATMQIIFANIDKLRVIHHGFAKRLREEVANWSPKETCISRAFLAELTTEKMQHAYAKYANNQDAAVRELAKAVAKHKSLSALIVAGESNPRCQRQPLRDLLMLPVQQISRYALYFRELQKASPPNHPDCEDISRLLNAFSTIVGSTNEAKRTQERGLDLFKVLDDIEDCPPNVYASKRDCLDRIPVHIRLEGAFKKGILLLMNDSLLAVVKVKDVRSKLTQAGLRIKSSKLLGFKPLKFLQFATFSDLNAFDFPDGGSEEHHRSFMLIFRKPSDRMSVDKSTAAEATWTGPRETKLLCLASTEIHKLEHLKAIRDQAMLAGIPLTEEMQQDASPDPSPAAKLQRAARYSTHRRSLSGDLGSFRWRRATSKEAEPDEAATTTRRSSKEQLNAPHSLAPSAHSSAPTAGERQPSRFSLKSSLQRTLSNINTRRERHEHALSRSPSSGAVIPRSSSLREESLRDLAQFSPKAPKSILMPSLTLTTVPSREEEPSGLSLSEFLSASSDHDQQAHDHELAQERVSEREEIEHEESLEPDQDSGAAPLLANLTAVGEMPVAVSAEVQLGLLRAASIEYQQRVCGFPASCALFSFRLPLMPCFVFVGEHSGLANFRVIAVKCCQ
eukprot:m.133708 g.133708  ORF g.133708 m.133708 type:complete len:1203 (+) comp52424_c0_seq3:47-3655(+)